MLGLGRKSGVKLGGERAGLIPTRAWKLKRWGVPWQTGETISTSIGQSFVLVTPIQVAGMMSAVFNGGKLYRPQLIKRIGRGREAAHSFAPNLISEIKVKRKNLELIKAALTAVVNEPHGTGGRARVKGITVAGKTGTAQVVNLETEKEAKSGEGVPMAYRDHAWFTAVAPVENPRLALAIVVEHGGHGGSAAAPIARAMIETYLNKGTDKGGRSGPVAGVVR
jgi:penicillin-binding protein 2